MKKNIAIFFYGLGDISGGGGAERFFAGFLKDYQNAKETGYKLSLLTDSGSYAQLEKIMDMSRLDNVYVFRIYSNRFKNTLEYMQIAGHLLFRRVRALQIPLYGAYYFPLLKKIDSMPRWMRPRIIVNITDSFLPHYYFDAENKKYDFKRIFGRLFQEIRIDAVVSWYELFRDFATRHSIIASNPPVYVIKSRYTSKTFDQNPVKKNEIVFAARLTDAKKPLMFVDAVAILKNRGINLSEWQFYIYGKGALEQEIKDRITSYGLEKLLTLTYATDLTQVLSGSKCFVSTMDFENFPSLAMNEAMAAGNAIIARNVGQTYLFVRHMKNGLLIDPDTEEGLANAIEYYITHPDEHAKMSAQSRQLTETEHTFTNFKNQMEGFWKNILN